MAEHRRVVPRNIIGTGMATDAERIRDIDAEQARRERAWRDAPAKGFSDVLSDAPARAALADEPDAQQDPRRRAPDVGPAAPDDAVAAGTDGAAVKPPARTQKPSSKPLPRLIPDPREARLRQQLAAGRVVQPPVRAGRAGETLADTPPTGSVARKP